MLILYCMLMNFSDRTPLTYLSVLSEVNWKFIVTVIKYIMTEIAPPESLLIPLNVPSKLLMGPGPSNCPPNVLSASSQQMLGHMDEDFLNIMEDVKKGIQYAFQTANKVTFAVSGTGHCAMETAIVNLLECGDIFLIASPGIWGDRALKIAERIGVQCIKISYEANQALDLKILEEVVAKIQPKVTFICHGDSSTGVLQPLDEIGDMLKKYDCLLLVDAVASLGAAPIFMDKQGIDVLYCGSQKILNAPPGISPISFSPKAVAKIKERKTPVPSFYMDCLLIGNYWNCDDEPIRYHHTAPINLVYALRVALSLLVKETLEKSWEKHSRYANMLHNRLENVGLKLFVTTKEHRLPSVTTLVIPENINGAEVVQMMRKRYKIDIAGGLGSTAGKVWRIGLMGYNCNAKNIAETVDALLTCIESVTLKSSL